LNSCTKLTDEAFHYLSSHLAVTLKDTTHLDLNFMGLNFFLSFLELNFFSCQLTDEAVKKLATSIGTNLTKLEHLSISLRM